MNESKAFRVKRAQDNVLRLAREWAKAEREWRLHDGTGSEDDRLYERQRLLRERLESACRELVAVEAEQ